jgi:hypothetical protein
MDSTTAPTKVWKGSPPSSPNWPSAFSVFTVKVTATANTVSETYTLIRKVDPCTASSIEEPSISPVIEIKAGNPLTISSII